MKRTAWSTAIALGITTLLAGAAPAVDTKAVLKTPQERVQTADFRATGHLTQVDAGGKRISYPVTVKAHWFPGVLRIMVDLEGPANAGPQARAHILLEMRPSGQSSIRIAHPGDKAAVVLPVEKWGDGPLGAGFSYEDFLEQQYFWPGQTVVEQTKRGARDCDVLLSVPGAADRTRYAQVKTWLDHTIGFPVYIEKTLKGTGAVKEFTYYGLRHEGGVWSASQVEAKVHGQGGSTLLIVDRGSAKANLGLSDFSPEQLTRFQDR
jgi:hypothetical protein